MLDILFTIIFLVGVFYLINYRLNIKKAAEQASEALYPKTETEFSTILIPPEFKEMKQLSKHTRSYQYVKWGTVAAFFVICVLFIIFLTTESIKPSFFNIVYIFIVLLSAIKHPGNLFILPKGIIFYGKYYSYSQVESYEVEQIIRWHELYGLHDRLNFAYKLTIKVKRSIFQPGYVVVEDIEHLEKITNLLQQHGIHGLQKSEELPLSKNVSK